MKKVLSFVLILALVLGSFSFAFGLSDISESPNTEAITVANDLGIITGYEDGTFLPEKTVNRAEFAAMITRALAIPESALAAYSATSFKDTSGYGWAVPYLAFCESKGIMIGDGYGNVMPGRTINVNEAITMAVRAIGYTENSSMLVGTWPSNYVTLAQTLGLYDDVAAMTMVSRESAAQVIYNALTVDMVSVNADGATNPTGKTMLTAGLGATVDAAVMVKGNESTNISLVKYVGAYADVYTKSDKVVAVGKVHSEFMTGDFTDYDTLTVDDVDYTFASTAAISVTPPAIKVVNGVYEAGAVTGGALTGSSVTVAVDRSGKTINKIYSVATWSGKVIEQANSNTVKVINEDQTLIGKDFSLNDDDSIDLSTFALYGVASLQDIAEDNVVEVWVGGTDSEITRVKVGTKMVTGKVTLVATVDGEVEYTIDGNAYTSVKDKPEIGDTGTAYLTYGGDIYKWSVEDGSAGNYAVMTDEVKNVTAYTSTSQVALFYKDGTESNYTFKAGVGSTFTTGATDALVRFDLNSDGKITTMSAIMGLATSKTSILSAKGTFDGKLLADTVVVFIDKGSQDYSIGSLKDVAVDESIAVRYAVNTNGKIDCMVVLEKDAGAETTYGFVVTTASGLNVAGDPALLVTALVDGALVTYITDDTADNYSAAANKLAKFAFAGGELTSATTISALDITPTAPASYAVNQAGSYATTGAVGFAFTSAAAVDSGRINMNFTTPDWQLVDDSALVLVAKFKSDGTTFDKFVKSSLSSINAGYYVSLIQLDIDSDVYDLVVYTKNATEVDNLNAKTLN